MKSSLVNMILVLGVITLISSAAVGSVYLLTKEPITKAKADIVNNSILAVMPPFDNDPGADSFTQNIDSEEITIYPTKNGDELLGYAIESFSKNGFSGKISIMVGMLKDGTINAITVVEQKETPGLGDKMQKTDVMTKQFKGKNPNDMKLAVKKDGGDVDAITASTISSRAFVDAVERAVKIFDNIQK